MELKTILGKNVKYYRYQKHLTQEQLAEDMDVSSKYIGRLEQGQHTPSLEKIENIAIALDIEAYKLFIPDTANHKLPDRVNLVNKK